MRTVISILAATLIALLVAAPLRPGVADEAAAPLLAAVSRAAGEVVLLDPETLETRARIAVGSGPHDIAAADDGTIAFAPLFGIFPAPHDGPIEPSELRWRSVASEGLAVFALGDEAARRVALPDCQRPHGAAIAPDGSIGWISCEAEGTVIEVSLPAGDVRRRWPVGNGVHKVMYLERPGLMVASNPGTGELSLLGLARDETRTIGTGAGAEALAASRDQSVVFVANGGARNACRVDVATAAIVWCAPSGGTFPIALAYDEARDWLWVAHNASSSLTVLDAGDGNLLRTIELPSPPLGMAFDAAGRQVYVGLPRQNRVVRIDADSGDVRASTTDVMEVDDIDLVPGRAFAVTPDT